MVRVLVVRIDGVHLLVGASLVIMHLIAGPVR